MRVIQSDHREENGRMMVRLLFKAREQLLDPGDPSPPSKQELTEEAEAAIITSFDAVSLRTPVDLEVLLPDTTDTGSPAAIPDAIRHHFRYVLDEHEKEWRIFVRGRRASLGFAVFNVLIAIFYVVTLYENEAWMMSLAGLVTGGVIVILNWATIWDTYEFFIFDTRERRHRKELLKKIIGAEIRINPVP